MFWEKKKKEGLPDLPNPPQNTALNFPSMTDSWDKEKPHELPAFPDSPMKRGFSQSAIKEAIATEEEDEDEEMPRIKEIPHWEPPVQSQEAPMIRERKPVFVRVDKFQLAMEALGNVKQKLGEIETLLKKIRDVKAKEDLELSSWETEMENAKTKIQTVLDQMFDRAE